eukprot:COSAG02_NODE_731_length_17977_cov_21.672838_24_plen_132_part_01
MYTCLQSIQIATALPYANHEWRSGGMVLGEYIVSPTGVLFSHHSQATYATGTRHPRGCKFAAQTHFGSGCLQFGNLQFGSPSTLPRVTVVKDIYRCSSVAFPTPTGSRRSGRPSHRPLPAVTAEVSGLGHYR